MSASELWTRTAIELADMLRRKEVSSRELTQTLLSRIDAVNPAVNAVVELRASAAMKEAATADVMTQRGDEVGPLHGVPMTIKDSFDVAGMHTTWGNPAFKEFVAVEDSTVAGRLRRAGAILIGKTNVHLMLGDFGQKANDLYGRTNNPWDATRTPGGSTGGGAAALAAGMTFLEYGSDLVGSIRIPASFCGVYGLKPSVGIVPLTGFRPPGDSRPATEMTYMSAIGPLARSADGLRLALSVTAGPEDPQAKACTWSLAPPRHRSLNDFRVGVVIDDDRAPVSSSPVHLRTLSTRSGTPARRSSRDGLKVSVPRSRTSPSGLTSAPSSRFKVPARPGGSARPGPTRAPSRRYAGRVGGVLQERRRLRLPDELHPGLPARCASSRRRTVATPEGERPYQDQAFWVSHASLPGLPAVAAPVGGTPTRLRVGIQVIGPLYEDDTRDHVRGAAGSRHRWLPVTAAVSRHSSEVATTGTRRRRLAGARAASAASAARHGRRRHRVGADVEGVPADGIRTGSLAASRSLPEGRNERPPGAHPRCERRGSQDSRRDGLPAVRQCGRRGASARRSGASGPCRRRRGVVGGANVPWRAADRGGAPADIVAFDVDPLLEPDALRYPSRIILRGRVLR